ncbi:MAG: DUF3667 domain-containing protein [Dokdonella sp.]
MIRHLSEVMSEFADIVFNVDSRIFRSLWDLYVRPGYLTVEYLAGRRARYVTPFRLFFFLSIIAFFSMQMALPEINPNEIKLGFYDSIEDAKTPEAVKEAVDAELAELMRQISDAEVSPEKRAKIEEKMLKLRQRGADRLQALKKEIDLAITSSPKDGASAASGDLPNSGSDGNNKKGATDQQSPASASAEGMAGDKSASEKDTPELFTFGQRWDSKTNPVHIGWLSDGLNAKLTHTLEHMQNNVENVKKDPGRLLAGFFSVLPQTLFVVMPLFAVLLKCLYLFKRRLYMEHLLVALHSHAFIFLSLLVILGLGALDGLAGARAWLTQPLGWLKAMAWIWLFLYLFVMQKRIYRQGWIMTSIKYCIIGISYSVILSFALAFAGLISLALT